MPDVVIHRCRVRVLRRGGWSWGPTPRELVNEVLRWLPQVLAARFGAETAEAGDTEIHELMRIIIPLKRDALGKLECRSVGATMLPAATSTAQGAQDHAHDVAHS